MASLTVDDVAARFAEAVDTGRRLPRIEVQGYFNVWPAFVRDEWETYPEEKPRYHPLPPTPKAIDRMLEVMRWVQWLEVEQRHLVWMRARQYGWCVISRRFACNRVTAWRRWQKALQVIAGQLKAAAPVAPMNRPEAKSQGG